MKIGSLNEGSGKAIVLDVDRYLVQYCHMFKNLSIVYLVQYCHVVNIPAGQSLRRHGVPRVFHQAFQIILHNSSMDVFYGVL